jgi:ABC-2 type transport system permease protein
MSLVAHQLRYEFKRFWRDPQSVFFTVALPIVFLVIFAGIFGNDTLDSRQNLKVSTYYVPGIITLGVISAAFVGLAISIVEQRERGILKRLRSTPLPPRVYIAARAGTAAVLTLLVTAALVLVGRLAYGVRVPTGALPGLLVTLVLGTASFALARVCRVGSHPLRERRAGGHERDRAAAADDLRGLLPRRPAA